jgi:hypothetical protein
MNLFDSWHKDVMFRVGVPRYARRLATNEIDTNYVLRQYAEWHRHPDSSDQRIRCGYDENLPADLIDKNAEWKYGFIKASYSEAEEMGFIKDRPKIVSEQVYDAIIPEIGDLTADAKLDTGRTANVYPEFNFEFIVALGKVVGFRNKYLVDLGCVDNRNRISLYLDREDFLCFRVIDSTSNSYVIRMSHAPLDKRFQIRCKFAKHPQMSYLEVYINETPVSIQRFNYRIPFWYYNKNMMFVGGDLDSTYCCKLKMYKGRIFAIKPDKTETLLSYDAANVQGMVFSGTDVIAYEDSSGTMRFHQH